MIRPGRLPDATIRQALTPGDDVTAPPGLLESIAREVRSTTQQPAGWLPLRTGRAGLSARWAWAAILGALVLMLLALMGLGAGSRHRAVLPVPSGVETMTPGPGIVWQVGEDGDGVLWAWGAGRLTKFDPAGSARMTWTVSDDLTFGDALVAPARAGGVWLWAGERIRRFSADGYLEDLPAPSSAASVLAEAPDGALWATTADVGLRRWDGSSWVPLPPGGPSDQTGPLLVRGPDDVWVALPPTQTVSGSAGNGVAHVVDGRWTTFGADDIPLLDRPIGDLEEAADGSIWASVDPGPGTVDLGIARFDGQDWTVVDGPGFPVWWLEAAADGSMWAVAGMPGVAVARHEDGSWTTYGPADGLLGTELGRVSATSSGVFLGTDAGLFRYEDGRWSPAWSDVPPGPMATPSALIAVSRDEAWVAAGADVWHVDHGAWDGPTRPWARSDVRIADLAVARGGELWAASERGVAVLRGDRWSVVDSRPAWSLDIGADATVWVGVDGGLRSVATGATILGPLVPCPIRGWRIAVAADGSVHLGDIAYSSGRPGLARFAGGACEAVEGVGKPEVVAIAADPTGGVVAHLLWPVEGSPSGAWSSQLVHLDGETLTILEDAGQIGSASGILAVDARGRIWRPREGATGGLERLEGGRWVLVTEVAATGPISVAPDGTAWFVGPSGVQRIPARPGD